MPGSETGTDQSAGGGIPVWDPVVRLTHAAVATLVFIDWVRDDGDWWHRQLGYVAAGLVALRLLWAAFNHGHAGLRALKPSVRATLTYLRGGAERTQGHDPLGVWMIWWLWLLILLLALTGWMSRLDAFWGDERVQNVHLWLANTLIVSVALHVSAVVLMSWRWRENLAASMVTGRKRPPDPS